MTDLLLHGRKVKTVFDLLGDSENDITYSVGWTLARSPAFCQALLAEIFPRSAVGEISAIRLQEFGSDLGFTDVEIIAEHARVFVEAKRGWHLPLPAQLTRYTPRLLEGSAQKAIVVMAECSPEYVRGRLPEFFGAVQVRYLSWMQLTMLAEQARAAGTRTERPLLNEFQAYLRGLISMPDQESNLVYVLSLAHGNPPWSSLPWIEYVTVKKRYFHPLGIKGWPTIPPNYLAFRYDGRLQSIHHVDSYDIVDNFAPFFPEIDEEKLLAAKDADAHVLYTLGPAIRPDHIVRTGSKVNRNARVRVALDLLLTCDTISEAFELTKKRLEKVK